MSRDFVTGYARANGTPITAAPMTVSAWIMEDAHNKMAGLVNICDSASANGNYFRLELNKTGSTVSWIAKDIAGGSGAETTSGITDGVWHHVCGVENADGTNRSVFLDGGNKGTHSTAQSPANIDRITLGAIDDTSVTDEFDGKIGHVAVWDVALTDQEVASLASGLSPLHIRPDNLVYYCPNNGNQSPEKDIVGGLSHTIVSASKFDGEPPIDSPIVTI